MILKEKLDNLHYSFREIDGYNKDINFIMSPRELGKTSMMWLNKVYIPWLKDKRPWIYLVRNSVEISEALIDSIIDGHLNKFTDDNIQAHYTKGSFKDGIVDVRITTNEIENPTILFRIISLSLPMRRLKLALLPNIKHIMTDEYIINPQSNEKYIKDEYHKIQEGFSTWRRASSERVKLYFLANPYSLYNPLFMGLGVHVEQLHRDSFLVGASYVIHWAILSDALRNKLLEENPFYKFDEDYSKYAIDGKAINDENIKVGKEPMNYRLRFLFRMDKRYIGVYQNNYIDNLQDMYFCKYEDIISNKRNVYCFDFKELVDGCAIMSREDKEKFARFKRAIQRNLVVYSDISVYYLIVEIYNFI